MNLKTASQLCTDRMPAYWAGKGSSTPCRVMLNAPLMSPCRLSNALQFAKLHCTGGQREGKQTCDNVGAIAIVRWVPWEAACSLLQGTGNWAVFTSEGIWIPRRGLSPSADGSQCNQEGQQQGNQTAAAQGVAQFPPGSSL